jgi:hypothetical protein
MNEREEPMGSTDDPSVLARQSTLDDADGRVEVCAVISSMGKTLGVRLGEEDGSALFLKPEKLDGDGEFYLDVGALAAALARMGIDIGTFSRAPWGPS